LNVLQLIEILVPNLFLAIPSLFIYPALCFAIGTSPTNSLAFAPCSITLALAQTSPNNLGGNFNVITPVVVVSGICGLIIGPTILKLIRIPGGKLLLLPSAAYHILTEDVQTTM